MFGFVGAGPCNEGMPAISVATPAALAALPVQGLENGQPAYVAAMRVGAGPGIYILQPVRSTAPDSFFVVATADDPARQWVFHSISEAGTLALYSAELDLTAIQTLTLVPPLAYRQTAIGAAGLAITQKDGTVTVGPTLQAGTDAGISNLCASTVQAALAAAALNTKVSLTGQPVTTAGLDMTTNGIRLQITVGATLGTATVFKARLGYFIFTTQYP